MAYVNAAQRHTELQGRYKAALPPKPEGAYFKLTDGLEGSALSKRDDNCPERRSYTEAGIAAYRMRAAGQLGEAAKHWQAEYRRAQIMRAREIVEAYDTWAAECRVLRRAMGVDDAAKAEDEAEMVWLEACGKLKALPVRSASDIAWKAKMLLSSGSEDDIADVLSELVAFAKIEH